MRSRPFKRDLRDRIEERTERHLYDCKCPRRRIARLDAINGGHYRLLTGTASCSRHRCGRAMRLWWRMKRFARSTSVFNPNGG